jgi:hypothetical protein
MRDHDDNQKGDGGGAARSRSLLRDPDVRSATKVGGLLLAVAATIGAIGVAYVVFNPPPKPQAHAEAPQATETAAPEVYRRAIDGMPLSEGTPQPRYFAVMIDNMVEARPQAGTAGASLVIEAPVEGGITRLLAVFAEDADVKRIGPVRSSRPYYIDWAQELDASYAHVGGSPEALEKLKTAKVTNLDEYFNGRYFWRDSTRRAPHQVFTSTDLLRKAAATKEEVTSEALALVAWEFRDPTPVESRPERAADIVVPFGSATYDVTWKYDRVAGTYARYQGGSLQKDDSGQEVRANNIAVLFTSVESIDAVDRKRIRTTGEGKAVVIRDGEAVAGTWKKKSASERLNFFDADGKPVAFDAGKTWIEIVPEGSGVRY